MSNENIPPKKTSSDTGKSDFIRGMTLLSQVGISITVCVLIGIFLGRFLDQFFGTSPWLL